MINYKDYEKEVYNWLSNKNEQDPNFRFSLRQNGSKGSELDYFIGTEKSKYFSTTFWTLPVNFPGSSGDAISLIFGFSNNVYGYNFEFTQTNSPKGAQNVSALNILKALKKNALESLGFSYISPENNKMFTLKTNQRQNSYTSLPTMLKDIEDDFKIIIPAVNQTINQEKKNNSEFKAHSITQDEFNKMQTKLEKRFIKYNNKIAVDEKSVLIREQFSEWLKGNESSKKINSYLRAVDILNETLKQDIYLEKKLKKLTLLYQDLIENQRDEKGKYFYATAPSYGNSGLYSASVKAFIEFLKEGHSLKTNKKQFNNFSNQSKNQILYGPPGTGKTYNTITEAVAIIQDKTYDEVKNSDRKTVKKDFDILSKKRQIMFTTFHQSMSYEDFVEGIKPVLIDDVAKDNQDVSYEILGGIFKQAAARAAYNSYKEFHVESNSGYTYSQLYEGFIEMAREKIAKKAFFTCETKTGSSVEIFRVNKNDSIHARAEGSHVTHVAPLTKENIQKLYDTYKSVDEINHLQEVKNVVGVSPRTTEFYAVFKALLNFEKSDFEPNIENEELKEIDLTDEEILLQFDSGVFTEMSRKFGNESSKVVLVIDEINRGNVSAIFGELITLLEKDKRLGEANELVITLPYSKGQFSVPSNLFIVGTMNTADRSVEALDTALRRRFEFKEMMPDYAVIENEEVNGLQLSEVLKTINERIELLIDRDHTIGHSYFFNVNSEEELANAFNNKIVPLLQEYFYGDYGKIGLVLGKGFVDKQKNDKVNFADFTYENANDFKTPSFLLKKVDKENIVEAVSIVLGKKQAE